MDKGSPSGTMHGGGGNGTTATTYSVAIVQLRAHWLQKRAVGVVSSRPNSLPAQNHAVGARRTHRPPRDQARVPREGRPYSLMRKISRVSSSLNTPRQLDTQIAGMLTRRAATALRTRPQLKVCAVGSPGVSMSRSRAPLQTATPTRFTGLPAQPLPGRSIPIGAWLCIEIY